MKLSEKPRKSMKGNPSLGILNSLGDEDISINPNEVDIDLVDFNELNFYNVSDNEEDIRDLAESIKEIGLLHNIVVRTGDNGHYTIISGEKRTKAYKLLFEETKDLKWKYIPCKIRDDIKNITDEEITLIKANRDVRDRSETVKAKEVERLEALYGSKKASGEKVGVIRKRIADDLGMSETQVHRYRKVNELIPEFKNMLDSGDINLTTVEHFTDFEPEVQKNIYDSLLDIGHKISRDEASEIKREVNTVINTSAINDGNSADPENKESGSPSSIKKTTNQAPRVDNKQHKKDVAAGVKTSVDIAMHIKKALSSVKSLASKLEELSQSKKKLSPENKELISAIKGIMDNIVI